MSLNVRQLRRIRVGQPRMTFQRLLSKRHLSCDGHRPGDLPPNKEHSFRDDAPGVTATTLATDAWTRVLKWTAISLASVLVIGGGGGYLPLSALLRPDHRPRRSSCPTGHQRRPKIVANAENFLLMGSDSRAGASGKGTGGSDVQGARSDTTILLHISAGDRKATMVSIPRDSYVQIPACVIGPNGQKSQPTVGQVQRGVLDRRAGRPEVRTELHDRHRREAHPRPHRPLRGHQLRRLRARRRRAWRGQDVRRRAARRPDRRHPGRLPRQRPQPAGRQERRDRRPAGARPHARALRPRRRRRPAPHQAAAGVHRRGRSARRSAPACCSTRSSCCASSTPRPSRSRPTGSGSRQMLKLAKAIHDVGPGGIQILTVPLDNTLPPGVPTADVAWDPVKSAELWNAIRHDKPIPGSAKAPGHRPTADHRAERHQRRRRERHHQEGPRRKVANRT